MKTQFLPPADERRARTHGRVGILLLALMIPAAMSAATSRYTEAQLQALAKRVGTIYWVAVINNRTPAFLAAPAANSPSLSVGDNESFEIVELIPQKDKDVYYKVKFDSGKEGYIRPELFVEELNLTILTADPLASEKKKATEAAEVERKRVEWIRSQPWTPAVKDAAIKRRPVAGHTPGEVKRILGNPVRVTKVTGQRVPEERWQYPDGSVVIFYNQLLIRMEASAGQKP